MNNILRNKYIRQLQKYGDGAAFGRAAPPFGYVCDVCAKRHIGFENNLYSFSYYC